MNSISVKAAAKINLALDVVSKRDDGYHDLSTIMHEIPLYDDLTLTFGGAAGIHTRTNFGFIREDTNIAGKAAKAFFDAIDQSNVSLEIKIHKRIPVGAGLGGGSADAAAVLKALNGRYNNRLTNEELSALGATLGADVPFCLHGGCALCEGIGDIITPLPKLPSAHLLVVKPKASISTADLFGRLNFLRRHEYPDIQGIIEALKSGNLNGVASLVFNALEAAAVKSCPEIAKIQQCIRSKGALGATMSGSGSAVFGIFDKYSLGKAAYKYFKSNYRDTFLLQI